MPIDASTEPYDDAGPGPGAARARIPGADRDDKGSDDDDAGSGEDTTRTVATSKVDFDERAEIDDDLAQAGSGARAADVDLTGTEKSPLDNLDDDADLDDAGSGVKGTLGDLDDDLDDLGGLDDGVDDGDPSSLKGDLFAGLGDDDADLEGKTFDADDDPDDPDDVDDGLIDDVFDFFDLG